MRRVQFAAFLGIIGVASYAGVLTAQTARAGRPLAIEDYYRLPTVGGTQISPDGKWVVFTISTRVESDNSSKTETHLVSADGSAPAVRVQHAGKDISGPRWTADNRLRFSGDAGVAIDPASPAAPATKVPVAPAPAGTPSPDGKWLMNLRDVPAPPMTPAAASEFVKRHQDRFKGVTFDWMEFQRDGQAFPAPDPRARQPIQIELKPTGEGSPVVLLKEQDLRPSGAVWHPSGRLVAFTADSDWRVEQKYERTAIWLGTVDGKATKLTDDGYVHSDLDFSPDGRFLSYARTYGTDMVIEQKLNHGGPRDLFLRVVDVAGAATGQPINLTKDWDLEPGATTWAPDGKSIYFTTGTGGETHLFRVAVPEGGVTQVTTGPRRLGGLTFDRAMKKIAYTVAVHDSLPDVFVAGIDGKNEKRLTSLHTTLEAEIAFSRTDRLEWKSYDGTRIEGWLTRPYGFTGTGGPYPLIVVSHGGPHAAAGYGFDFKKQYFAANGYFVLDTNFRSSTGYGEAFKWATWGEWGKKDGEDVMSGIDHVIRTYPVDRRRVGHMGHSYGGFMTNWLITQYPDRFAAAIAGAGISNWISDYGTADIYRTKETEFFGPPWDPAARDRMIKQSPITYAGRVTAPTLFIHGEVDQRVPYEEAEQMYFALRRRGIPAKMIRYAGQPHGIGGHWNNIHRMWNELQWWELYLKAPQK